MRTGRRPQRVRQLDGARHARPEADAVVRAGHVVVHRLGNGNDLDPFLVEPVAVAERIVPADRNQVVQPQEFDVLEDVWRDVVDVIGVAVGQMRRNHGLGQVARAGAGRMQERASGPSRTVHHLLGQDLVALRVVGIRLRNDVHQTGPTAADPDHAVPFAHGADGHGADGGIEAGDVAAARKDADGAFVGSHGGCRKNWGWGAIRRQRTGLLAELECRSGWRGTQRK